MARTNKEIADLVANIEVGQAIYKIAFSPAYDAYLKQGYAPNIAAKHAMKLAVRVTNGATQRPLVTIDLGGQRYGLNGAAMGVGGYPTVRQQMARDPKTDAFHFGATDHFIKLGLALCGR